MDHHVGAMLDRLQQDRRRHGVVDDQRHAGRMRDRGQGLKIDDVAGGIADAFAIDRAGIAVDAGGDVVGLVALGEADLDALLPEDMSEERVGRAVKLRHRDEIRALLEQRGERVVDRGRARADAQRRDAAFKAATRFSNTALVGLLRRV